MTKTTVVGTTCGLCAIVIVACGGQAPPAATPTGTPGAEPAGGPSAATFDAQAAAGQQLYAESCASCHGASGEGGRAPRVVGLKDGALPLDPPAGSKSRKTQFKTVADVADYVVKNMPPKAPGSLKDDEYWSILAFDLKANGISLGDKRLDAAVAATLTIPR